LNNCYSVLVSLKLCYYLFIFLSEILTRSSFLFLYCGCQSKLYIFINKAEIKNQFLIFITNKFLVSEKNNLFLTSNWSENLLFLYLENVSLHFFFNYYSFSVHAYTYIYRCIAWREEKQRGMSARLYERFQVDIRFINMSRFLLLSHIDNAERFLDLFFKHKRNANRFHPLHFLFLIFLKKKKNKKLKNIHFF